MRKTREKENIEKLRVEKNSQLEVSKYWRVVKKGTRVVQLSNKTGMSHFHGKDA